MQRAGRGLVIQGVTVLVADDFQVLLLGESFQVAVRAKQAHQAAPALSLMLTCIGL